MIFKIAGKMFNFPLMDWTEEYLDEKERRKVDVA